MNDIVYFVKESKTNEELKYSLRSVVENFEYRKIWFLGGCPEDLEPDIWIPMGQHRNTKWDNVRMMLTEVLKYEELTEDFYLFNDDFFIMHPYEYEHVYNGDLYELIVKTEDDWGSVSRYTKRMRDAARQLESLGCDVKNYAVHMPMLINKKKALKTLKVFPTNTQFRSLYGNYNNIGGVNKPDCKIRDTQEMPDPDAPLLSTMDRSFKYGEIGKYIRAQFPEPSKYEK